MYFGTFNIQSTDTCILETFIVQSKDYTDSNLVLLWKKFVYQGKKISTCTTYTEGIIQVIYLKGHQWGHHRWGQGQKDSDLHLQKTIIRY